MRAEDGDAPIGEVTEDDFLGGRLSVLQPRSGYRAGVDPVLLAASVPARAGQTVLDLGCGAGVASLCLARRVPGLGLWGLEIQEGYAGLARRNAARNGVELSVVTGDVAAMPADLRMRAFDHVIANPPYFERTRGTAADGAGRETARGETVPLAGWIEAGARRLAPKGRLTIVQRAGRLPELVDGMTRHLGSVAVVPLAPRRGRDAALVLVSGVKGGRAEFRLLPPVVLHDGERHERDGDDYSAAVSAVLREAEPLAGFGA